MKILKTIKSSLQFTSQTATLQLWTFGKTALSVKIIRTYTKTDEQDALLFRFPLARLHSLADLIEKLIAGRRERSEDIDAFEDSWLSIAYINDIDLKAPIGADILESFLTIEGQTENESHQTVVSLDAATEFCEFLREFKFTETALPKSENPKPKLIHIAPALDAQPQQFARQPKKSNTVSRVPKPDRWANERENAMAKAISRLPIHYLANRQRK